MVSLFVSMRFLLTSGGLTTPTLRSAFVELFDGPIADARVVYVPTAATIYADVKDIAWMQLDIEDIAKTGCARPEIVDISKCRVDEWLPAFEQADCIAFGGGNSYHLLDQVRDRGLVKYLGELLRGRVFMGTSAGSMVMGPSLESNSPLFPEEDDRKSLDLRGLGFVNFAVIPHMFSPSYSKAVPSEIERFASRVSYPVCGLDDASAVCVVDGKAYVVSTGR